MEPGRQHAGDGIDFGARRQGDLLRLRPGVDFRLGRPLDLGLSHTFERLLVDGAESFRVNLSQLRLVYHLDVRTFFRGVLQYRDRPDLDMTQQGRTFFLKMGHAFRP